MIDNKGFKPDVREDIKAMRYQAVTIEGLTDNNEILTRIKEMWELREEGKHFLPLD